MKDTLQDKFERETKLFDDSFSEHISVVEELDDPTGEWYREKDSIDGLNPEKRSIEVYSEDGDYIEDDSEAEDNRDYGWYDQPDFEGGDLGGGGLWFTDKSKKRIEFELREVGKDVVMFIKNPDGTWSKASDENRELVEKAHSDNRMAKSIGLTTSAILTDKQVSEMAKAKDEIVKEETKKEQAAKEKEPETSNVSSDNTSYLEQKRNDTQKKLEANDAKRKAEELSNKNKSAAAGKNSYFQNDGRIVLQESNGKDKKTEGQKPVEPVRSDYATDEEYELAFSQFILLLTEYEQSKKDADESADYQDSAEEENDFTDAEIEQDVATLEADLAEIDAILEMSKQTIDSERIVPAE